jgi:RNA polymerase sigma-70 factor (ECF subfamily)
MKIYVGFPIRLAILLQVNDQQLLAAYLQGDEHALETLVQNYYRLVIATATRATRDPNLAQDIAQTVFLIFARKARQLSREVSLPGWFIRTTQFVSRDATRKAARRSHYEAASTAEPRDRNETHEVTAAALLLTEAILALSPKEQVCVLARFYDERAIAQIAQDHGISQDAVQKRVERGLGKMRSFFARRGFRVAGAVVPGLFVTAFPRGAEAQAVQAVLGGLHAAKTGAITASLLHANQLAQAITRRKLLSIGLKSGAALLVASAGVGAYVALHQPVIPALPPFRPSSAQIVGLGRAWADVARQVAAFMANLQARPQPANAPPPAIIMTETVRISTELEALRTPATERILMADFLTIELRDTLHLSEPQQAYVFSLFQEQLANGDSLIAGMQATYAAKATLADKIRSHLSLLQRRRFDYTYGKDNLGFLSFLAVLTGN